MKCRVDVSTHEADVSEMAGNVGEGREEGICYKVVTVVTLNVFRKCECKGKG